MNQEEKNLKLLRWKVENKEGIIVKLLAFLISPVLGVLSCLRSLNTRSSFFFIFCALLCFGLSITVDSYYNQYEAILYADYFIDSMYHRADFELYKDITFNEYIKIIANTFTGDISQEKDIFAPTLKFIVSRFTSNYHYFFLVVAFIYALFALKSLRFMTGDSNYDSSLIVFILIFIFSQIQVSQINGVRFYTTAWVAIYAILKMLITKRSTYALLLCVTPLMHISYIYIIFVFLLYVLTSKYDKFWSIALFLSILLSEFLQVSSIFTNFMPSFISDWVTYYTDQEINSNNTLGVIFSTLVRVYQYLLVFIIIKNSQDVKNNPKTSRLYRFLLIYMTITTLVLPISNLGSRFIMLSWSFIAYIWLVVLKKRYNWVIYSSIIVFAHTIIRRIPESYNLLLEPSFYYTSPIILTIKNLFL